MTSSLFTCSALQSCISPIASVENGCWLRYLATILTLHVLTNTHLLLIIFWIIGSSWHVFEMFCLHLFFTFLLWFAAWYHPPVTDPRFWQWSLLSNNLSVRSTNWSLVRLHSSRGPARRPPHFHQHPTYFLKVWTEMISSEGWSLCSSLLKPKDSSCFWPFHFVT